MWDSFDLQMSSDITAGAALELLSHIDLCWFVSYSGGLKESKVILWFKLVVVYKRRRFAGIEKRRHFCGTEVSQMTHK